MARLTVTSERLRDVSSNLQNGSADVQSRLDGMKREVEQLQADWEGAGATGFQDLYQKWQTSATNLREALDGISTQLRQAAEAYELTEDQVRQSMQQG